MIITKSRTSVIKQGSRFYQFSFFILQFIACVVSLHYIISNNVPVQTALSNHPLSKEDLPLCQLEISTLGPIDTEANVRSLDNADSKERQALTLQLIKGGLKFGGYSAPLHCKAAAKAAIIVPFRNREHHLDIFLRYMHSFLQRKLLDYRIFVIEQTRIKPFNRGSLMNVGFVEALNSDPAFDCFIFHDVDLLPEHHRNDYSCPPEGKPRQLAWLMDLWDYEPMYPEYAGGVTAISKNDFMLVNGFSNRFWAWGAEDDDFYRRIKSQNLTLSRSSDTDPLAAEYSKFRSIYHKQAKINNNRIETLIKTKGLGNLIADGISSLKYEQKHFQLRPYYTHIIVNIV